MEEEEKSYLVEITPSAEKAYLNLLFYLYRTHSQKSADTKSKDLLDVAYSLSSFPDRGKVEEELVFLMKEYRFLVYSITGRKSVKIIYFTDHNKQKVYITDFFPTEMDHRKIKKRN